MLLKRYSESSVTESIADVSVFDVPLAFKAEVLVSSIAETSCGGGGAVTPGVSILPAKAVVESARLSIVTIQSCCNLFIVNLLSILF